jgi:hypothetical protein
MNVKSIILSVFCLLIVSNRVTAQLNILNAKTPEEIGLKTEDQLAYDNDQPLPYGFIVVKNYLGNYRFGRANKFSVVLPDRYK